MKYARNALLIKRKFWEFLLPTVLTSMAVSLASVVDGIIVGGLLGERALAAVGLSGPVVLALNALFYLFAVGGISGAARARGARNAEKADECFTLCALGGTFLSALYALAVFVLSAPLSRALSPGDPALAELTRQYIASVVWTGPFLTFSLTLAQFWKSDGSPKAATLVALVANVVNLILDYTLIRFFNTGIMGAGLSTTLGYIAGVLVTVPYLRSPKRSFRFVKIARGAITKTLDIVRGGAYRSLQSLSSVVQALVVNSLIVRIFGSVGMTVMTVCNNASMIALIFSGGISETILPIISALSGEKDYFGIHEALKKALWTLMSVILFLTMLFIVFPGIMGTLFSVKGADAKELLSFAIRLYALSLPFFALNQLFQNYFGSVGQSTLATAIPFVDSFILLIGYALIITRINGSLIWLCYLCAELTTVLLVCAASRFLRGRNTDLKGLFLLPEQDERQKWEATITVDALSGVSVSQQVIDFCRGNGVSPVLANELGLSVEEYCVNAAAINKAEKSPTMDLLLSSSPDELLLRLRDDGVPNNPLEQDTPDDMPYERINLVKKLAGDVEYSHLLGFNTTILTFPMQKQ